MWKKLTKKMQIPPSDRHIRKRKTANAERPPPKKKRTVKNQSKPSHNHCVNPRFDHISTSTSSCIEKFTAGPAAASSSSSCFRNNAKSPINNNLIPCSDSVFLQEEEEIQTAGKPLHNENNKNKSASEKIRKESAENASSEISCLEPLIRKEAVAAAASEQFSCSGRKTSPSRLENASAERYFGQNVVPSEEFSPNGGKIQNFGHNFTFSEQLSCSDESLFEAEIETAMSKLANEPFSYSTDTVSDATPSYWNSDSQGYTPAQFFSATSEDLQNSSARRSSIATCTSSLITELEGKFSSWKPCTLFGPDDLSEFCREDESPFPDIQQDSDCTDEEEDTFRKFKRRERKQAFLGDYLGRSLDRELIDVIGKQRLLMVNWIMEYTASYELQWETLFLSTSLMDRVLSKGAFQSESHLQVLGIACMTLAIRLEEKQPSNCITRETFTVSHNVFNRSEVVAMEWLVLKILNYRCSLPTTATFIWYYLKAAQGDAEVEKTAKYLACLSLVDHQLLRFWPSTIAASLVVLTCQVLGRPYSSFQFIIEKHRKDGNEDLTDCVERLEWLLENVW